MAKESDADKQMELPIPGLNPKTRRRAHGGELSKGKRKEKRPFDPKQALHVVLRASSANGTRSMLHPRNCGAIRGHLSTTQKRWGIAVYRYANVGNHLHLLVRAKSRKQWQGFIREFSGGIAMIVTGARKGNGIERDAGEVRGFWDGLVFTRIVQWGKDFRHVAAYVCKNLWKAAGIPICKYLERGYELLEISDDGALLIANATTNTS